MQHIKRKRHELLEEGLETRWNFFVVWISRYARLRIIALISRGVAAFNKTNLFNMTTKRYSEHDIEKLMSDGDVWSFQVSDRFGDLGLVAVTIFVDGVIETMLLSCRALGRKIETCVLRLMCDRYGQDLKAYRVPTKKNLQCASFLEDNGFTLEEHCNVSNLYIYSCAQGPARCDFIKLDVIDG